MICIGVILAYCFQPTPAPEDSFCSVYQRIVVAQGDSQIKAPLAVKQRILANELTFRKLCEAK